MTTAGIIPQDSWPNRFSEAYRKKAEEIRREVTMRHTAQYAKASWWGKAVINFKIAREVGKELRKFDPRYRL